MKRLRLCAVLLSLSAAATIAWGGHELPIYPSFYPHEVDIQKVAPEAAADALRNAKIHAYVGRGVSFSATPPDAIGTVESLGAFVLVRVNPQSTRVRDEHAMCAAASTIMQQLGKDDIVLHPYPVTPLHGDYLYFSDLVATAAARFARGPQEPPLPDIKIRATGSVAKSHPAWTAPADDWDVEVFDVDAADLVVASSIATNGWIAPPWVKTGWFQAAQLLSDSIGDPAQKERADTDRRRLLAGDFKDLTERVNIERDFISTLTAGCRTVVAGYTRKREYFNREFSAGIENIGYDAIAGLHSPMFIRTAKLKDFPWNGWLRLGIDAGPTAAWNPIGGMTDPFGRLMWSAMGDPALLPSPYDAGWMLNRLADIRPSQGQ